MTPNQAHPTQPANPKTSTTVRTIQTFVSLLLLAASITFLMALRRMESNLDRGNTRPAPAAHRVVR